MSEHIVVGLDVDGVLRDFVSGVIRAYRLRYPDHEIRPITAWGLEQFFPIGRGIYDFIWHDMTSTVCYNFSNPYPGAVDFVRTLSTMRHVSIAIVTSQPSISARTMTWDWLAEQGFLEIVDSIIMLGSGTKKTDIKLDILLDDCTDNLKRQRCPYPVCFDRPWNQDWDGMRVKTYEQFLEWMAAYVSYRTRLQRLDEIIHGSKTPVGLS